MTQFSQRESCCSRRRRARTRFSNHTAWSAGLDPEPFGSQEAFQARFLPNDDVDQRDADQLFEAQDDVDKKRTDLIEVIDRQLETNTVVKQLFTLYWSLAGAAKAGGAA